MKYISGQVHCKLQGVSYIVSKRHKLWSTNGLKLEVSFEPPYVGLNSASHFIAKLRRRRSANGTQPNFGKRSAVIRANNLRQESWGRPFGKMGAKNFCICSDFRRLRDLMANICRMKRDIDNRARALKINTKYKLRCPKIS